MTIENAELTTEQVLRRDILWETYMTTKLISGTDLQLLKRYDKMAESYNASCWMMMVQLISMFLLLFYEISSRKKLWNMF